MKIKSFVSRGFDGEIVEVEIDLRRGIPGMEIVGLPDIAVREARERVRAAVRNSGFTVPRERVLVNLAPAGVKKEGASFDLPIAVALLLATGQVGLETDPEGSSDLLVVGELELSGAVRPVDGVIAAVASGYEDGIEKALVPEENLGEADSVEGVQSMGIVSLADLPLVGARLLHGIPEEKRRLVYGKREREEARVEDIVGQRRLKRSLEIAAAGGHHLLLFGPPGVGKTMAARRLAPLLPELTTREAMEVTRIHSLAGLVGPKGGLIYRPPMRSPHHTASREGLIGGADGRPGEISLSHRGVLFLDEALEFHKTLLQSLREPIERGEVEIARAGVHFRYPARFQLVLAANPCPCGKLGRPEAVCMCSKIEIHRYWKKLGAALLDRVDMRLPVKPEPLSIVPPADKTKGRPEGETRRQTDGESGRQKDKQAGRWPEGEVNSVPADNYINNCSREAVKRVELAVKMQKERFKSMDIDRNVNMGPESVFSLCRMDKKAAQLLSRVSSELGLSSRAVQSVVKIARTIADLDAIETVEEDHIGEAVEYRRYGDGDYYWRSA